MRNVSEPPKSSDAETFDAISCQFAYHYSFRDKETVLNAIRNVSRLLKNGGKFLLTIPDSEVIFHRLRKAPGLSFGNNLYRITFEDKKNFYKYGQKYIFYLHEAIDSCPEYMVPLQTLIDVAKNENLELVYSQNFEKMFREYRDPYLRLLQRMRINPEDPLTQEEKEAASLYMGVVFVKNKPDQPKSKAIVEEAKDRPDDCAAAISSSAT